MLWLFSITTWCLLGFFGAFIALIIKDRKENKKGSYKVAPGPRQWPIIGSIPFMAKYSDPCKAFSFLAKTYGEVVTLKLGSVDTVIISGIDKIRDCLITRGHLFDSRPNFTRFNMLFAEKNNSIAFSDCNEMLMKRRNLIAHHSYPRPSTNFFETLDIITTENIVDFLDTLKGDISKAENNSYAIKSDIAKLISKMFFKYFCNTDSDYKDPLFQNYVIYMDMIFEEINNGCIGDLLPSLMPFINKSHLVDASHEIRKFVERVVVNPRLALMKAKKEGQKFSADENNNACSTEIPDDLLNSFLSATETTEGLTVDLVMYALEDVIGGHAAISNSFIRILYHIARAPDVQEKVRDEILNNSSGFMKLGYKLPYTEAALWEAFRHISSPIVPHQTSEDVFVDDYFVKKGTVVFLNNYDMHFSPKYWKNPEEFNPERFLTEDGNVLKPEYFFPFSTGKRSCLGYKLTIYICTVLLANLCLNYRIELDPTEDYTMPQGNIAVPGVAKRFIYRPIEC